MTVADDSVLSDVLPAPSPAVALRFRPARHEDTPAINSAFFRGFWDACGSMSGVPSHKWSRLARNIWDGVRNEYETIIACPDVADASEDAFAGFAVYTPALARNPAILAWIYVPYSWRRLGVGTALMSRMGIRPGVPFISLLATPQKLGLAESKGYRPIYMPYATWRWI